MCSLSMISKCLYGIRFLSLKFLHGYHTRMMERRNDSARNCVKLLTIAHCITFCPVFPFSINITRQYGFHSKPYLHLIVSHFADIYLCRALRKSTNHNLGTKHLHHLQQLIGIRKRRRKTCKYTHSLTPTRYS